MQLCPRCGIPPESGTPFCTACGTPIAAGPAPAPRRVGATMLGLAVETPPPAPASVTPPAAPPPPSAAPAPAPVRTSDAMRTMLGIAAADAPAVASRPAPQRTQMGFAPPAARLPVAPPTEPPLSAPTAPTPPPPAAAVARREGSRTRLGVAVPGIAPAASGAKALASRNATRFGVAVPGIAPLHEPAPTEPDDDLPLAPPPPATGRRVAVIVGGAALVLAVVGAVAVWRWRIAPAVTVAVRSDAAGHDTLHVTCGSCPDGTTLSAGGAPATLQAHAADVTPGTPLRLGANDLDLVVVRPGTAHQEHVRVSAVLAYRVTLERSTLSGERATVGVHLDAKPGSTLACDGARATADADGHALLPIDLGAETVGASDDVVTVDRKLAYTVVAAPGTESASGELALRASVAPLHIDAPGARITIATPTFWLAGRTAPGASVWAGGRSVPVASDGTFQHAMAVSAEGEADLEVRASSPELATRRASIHVRRVADLAAEARARAARPLLAMADLFAAPEAHAGEAVAITGEVVDARTQDRRTTIVLGLASGCAQRPCLVRVVHGAAVALARGDVVRAFGTVRGAFVEPSGHALPDVTADLVVGAK